MTEFTIQKHDASNIPKIGQKVLNSNYKIKKAVKNQKVVWKKYPKMDEETAPDGPKCRKPEAPQPKIGSLRT